LFRSELLAKWLPDRDDQYTFYGTIGAGLGTYARLSYKNYLLRCYIHEADPVMKDIIAGRYPFAEAELRGAKAYLMKFSKTPRLWLVMYPLGFVGYEVLKRGPKFWLWGKQV